MVAYKVNCLTVKLFHLRVVPWFGFHDDFTILFQNAGHNYITMKIIKGIHGPDVML